MPGSSYTEEELEALQRIGDEAMHLFDPTYQEKKEKLERDQERIKVEIAELIEKLEKEKLKFDENVNDKIDPEEFLGIEL